MNLWQSHITMLLLAVVILIGITTVSWATDGSARARIKNKKIFGIVGHSVAIEVELTEQLLPSGTMYSVVAEEIVCPGDTPPVITSGLPTTTVTCLYPGKYQIRIRINLVNKTSCGGASFQTILDDNVLLIISNKVVPSDARE